MRDRSKSTLVAASNYNWVRNDGVTGTIALGNPAYYSTMSRMRDSSDKEKHSFKPCFHLSYDASVVPFDSLDDSNPNNLLWINYLARQGFHYGQHLPPATFADWENYIAVSSNSTDDIGKCVFDAYNQYVNGYRALDASQSIAEVNETPKLFEMWSRRRGLASNLTNGFLNYSFGWRPVLSDLRAISHELRGLKASVRKRLKGIGTKQVTRHYTFNLDNTVTSPAGTYSVVGARTPKAYAFDNRRYDTTPGLNRRKVIVTIRASVRPKLTGSGQDIMNNLGALGLIPSLATLWAVTRYSFVVDWFYNIGGAIENLQGSLTHDVSNVEICVTDTRTRQLRYWFETGLTVPEQDSVVGLENQRSFFRTIPTGYQKFIPQLTLPRQPMQYVLLGFLALTQSDVGRKLLRTADRYTNPLDKRLNNIDKILRKAPESFNKIADRYLIGTKIGGFAYGPR